MNMLKHFVLIWLTNKILKMNSIIEDCLEGNHDLVVIYCKSCGYDEEEVVRWCKRCGSIVIDRDVDGRTSPGEIMKMKTHEISKAEIN